MARKTAANTKKKKKEEINIIPLKKNVLKLTKAQQLEIQRITIFEELSRLHNFNLGGKVEDLPFGRRKND